MGFEPVKVLKVAQATAGLSEQELKKELLGEIEFELFKRAQDEQGSQ